MDLEPADNGDKEYLMTLSITELISNLRTAFRTADYNMVEEVLVGKETELKAKIKELTNKLELERLERMSVEDELRKQCEMRKDAEERCEKLLQAMKKNNDLDDENADESWKNKLELSEGHVILEKGMNLVIGNGGDADDLSGLQGNIDAGGSNEVIGKKDMNDVDICDNDHEKITAGARPSLRNDLKPVSTRTSVGEITRHSPDSPNKTLLGTSVVSNKVIGKMDMNDVDICDNECQNITALAPLSQIKDLKSVNTHLSDVEVTKHSFDSPNKAVTVLGTLGPSRSRRRNRSSTSFKQTSACEDVYKRKSARYRGLFTIFQSSFKEVAPVVSTEDMDQQENEEVNIDDHGCGNIVIDASPSQRKTDDVENNHLVFDDYAKQSPETLHMNVLGASANPSLGSQKVVIDIEDSDDDNVDDECFISEALNGKEEPCDIATFGYSRHSNVSRIIEPLKRKWFSEAGNSFDGLDKNTVDGFDSYDDSCSSTSSLDSEINEVHLPLNFLCSKDRI